MWRYATIFGIRPGARAWSLTSASPMTGLGQADVQQNGCLSHPQDRDAPLRIAAQRKIAAYQQQYADNQNISFLPAIVSTSTRMHGVFFFYRPTGRLRHTSLPLECHRKPTTRKHSGSSARHSTTA